MPNSLLLSTPAPSHQVVPHFFHPPLSSLSLNQQALVSVAEHCAAGSDHPSPTCHRPNNLPNLPICLSIPIHYPSLRIPVTTHYTYQTRHTTYLSICSVSVLLRVIPYPRVSSTSTSLWSCFGATLLWFDVQIRVMIIPSTLRVVNLTSPNKSLWIPRTISTYDFKVFACYTYIHNVNYVGTILETNSFNVSFGNLRCFELYLHWSCCLHTKCIRSNLP